jgi:hypothetical protein
MAEMSLGASLWRQTSQGSEHCTVRDISWSIVDRRRLYSEIRRNGAYIIIANLINLKVRCIQILALAEVLAVLGDPALRPDGDRVRGGREVGGVAFEEVVEVGC